MALVLNATSEIQKVVVFGNHFELKPDQIKNFTDAIAHFMCTNLRERGFVGLNEKFEDPTYKETEAGKEEYARLKQEGVQARVKKLREIIYNNQVSLRQDLERANIKADPRVYASDGEIAAMEELSKYQQAMSDESQKKVDHIKELEKTIGQIKL